MDGFGGALEKKKMIVCRMSLVPGGHRIRNLGSGRIEIRGRADLAEGS